MRQRSIHEGAGDKDATPNKDWISNNDFSFIHVSFPCYSTKKVIKVLNKKGQNS